MIQSNMPVVVMTSPKSDWALGGLFWTLNKYYPELRDVWVCSYGVGPPPNIPRWANYYSIGAFDVYPKNRWSDAFIKVCNFFLSNNRAHFMFLMDDFWLCRRVDSHGVELLYEGMKRNNQVLKMDLATDRLYAQRGEKYLYGANTAGVEGHLDIIQSDPATEYHMSLWVGIFSARLLLDYVLVPGESAQEIEISGTRRLKEYPEVIVLGTRQAPVRCSNLIRGGHAGVEYRGYNLNGDWVNGIGNRDLDQMRREGVELR
jgi:hypothetical protein